MRCFLFNCVNVRSLILRILMLKCGNVRNKCENTSLGIIEMDDKQRYYCLADNCKFETTQTNSNG